MALKVLQLNDWRVKEAMKHEAIAGKKPIARGAFSMVFEGSKPNTVYKMTTDSFGYWMLNCYAMRVTHHHFPKTFKDFGVVGEVHMSGKDFPIYLFEMEKLQKLESGTWANYLAKRIAKQCGVSTWSNFGMNKLDRAMFAIQDMMRNKTLPRSVKNALVQLEEFCCNCPGANLDMHRANFMMRKNGDLVITDPLMDNNVYEARTKQLFNRGY